MTYKLGKLVGDWSRGIYGTNTRIAYRAEYEGGTTCASTGLPMRANVIIACNGGTVYPSYTVASSIISTCVCKFFFLYLHTICADFLFV